MSRRSKPVPDATPAAPPALDAAAPAAVIAPRTLEAAMAETRPPADMETDGLLADAQALRGTWSTVQALNLQWIAAKKNAEIKIRELEAEVAAKLAERQKAEAVHQIAAERLRLVAAALGERA